MKRLILCLALLTLAASAQVSSGTARRVVKGTSAPAACQVGDIFFDTDATAGSNLQGCTATNTWTGLGSSTPGGANTQVQFNGSGAFSGDAKLTWNNTSKSLQLGTMSPFTSGILFPDLTGEASGVTGCLNNLGTDPVFQNPCKVVQAQDNNNEPGVVLQVLGANTSAAARSLWRGVDYSVEQDGTGALTDLQAAYYSTTKSGTGPVTNAWGIVVNTYDGAGSSSTNSGGILIDLRGDCDGGTCTNNYGVRIEDVIDATNNWSIWAGRGKSWWGDRMIVAPLDASANAVLNLNPATGHTGNLLQAQVNSVDKFVVAADGTMTAGGSGTVGDLKLNTGACPAGSASTVTHCADTGDIPRVRQGTGTATALSGAIVDASATTASNPSAEASLKSVTLATNILNAADRTINVVSAGGYTTAAAQTPTIRIRGKLCTVSGCGSGTVITLFDFTTPATTASATSMGWSCDVTISTRTSGAAGVVVPGGQCSFNLGTSNTTVTATHTPTVSAVASSAIDLTGTVYYQLTWLNSSSDAGNSAVQNMSVTTPLR